MGTDGEPVERQVEQLVHRLAPADRKPIWVRARGKKAKAYLNDRGFRILAAIDRIAPRYVATPGKVAIAWLLTQPTVTAPIACAMSVEQLNDLVDATRLALDSEAV